MAGAVEKADGARGRAFRLVAAGSKNIDAPAVDVATVGAGADLLECGELGGTDGGDQRVLGFARAAAPSGLCAPSSRILWPEARVTICSRPGQWTRESPARMDSSLTGICGARVRTAAKATAAFIL